MHKSNEDCFYFLTSSCTKGAACTYRHSPLALTTNVVCPSWSRGNCLDPACPLRHTTPQRPMMSNGIMCFYENTPTGCLKPECTFLHSRSRMNLRNTAAIRPLMAPPANKDVTKPTTVAQIAPVEPPRTEPSLPPPVIHEPQPPAKSEIIVVRRGGISPNSEANSVVDANNQAPKKPSTRSVITSDTKDEPETIPTAPARLVVNRNVPTNTSNRTIVESAPPSSNRVVVSSKVKEHELDVSEQENNSKKFKSDCPSTANVPAPTMVNRSGTVSPPKTSPVNKSKPVRLNREPLPDPSVSNGTSPTATSPSSSEEKSSAGAGLSKDAERRTLRLERFQKKPDSPPPVTPAIIASATSNEVTSPTKERKRMAPDTPNKDAPVPKRAPPSTLPSPTSSPGLRPRLTTQSVVTSIRQASPIALKRPLATVTTPSKAHEPSPSNPTNGDNENLQLATLADQTDVADTFALIDAVLFETDQLLELM